MRVRVVFGITLIAAIMAGSPIAEADHGSESESALGGAGSSRRLSAIAQSNPQLSTELLNSLPESVLDNGSIWVDPSLPPGTAFVLADEEGRMSVAPGQSAQQTQAAEEALDSTDLLAACATRAVVPAFVTGLAITSVCPAIIGTSPTTTVTYTVTKGCNACYAVSWAPWGFNKKWAVITKPPVAPQYGWVYTGAWMTGRVGDGTSTVTWGAVAAMAKVRFNNASTQGWSGTFIP